LELIDEFIRRYTREQDYYEQVGRLAARTLELRLQEAGIRAIVTHRAKSVNRLREKCLKRNARTQYASIEQIYNDIVDLVGVRVALYFPGERDQVDTTIRQIFDLVEPRREFPDVDAVRTGKKFSGYSALHYRVQLRSTELAEAEDRYSLAKIEIQVASVLMHAWSEVEHDLVYKPLSGTTLSKDELALLDQLNGLVLAGEIALERLQEAGRRRVRSDGEFANHYDLANFLVGQAGRIRDEPITSDSLSESSGLRLTNCGRTWSLCMTTSRCVHSQNNWWIQSLTKPPTCTTYSEKFARRWPEAARVDLLTNTSN
jgi:ppGpp synthetase/RelA/SpoT-type nucleotidyltranferase